MSRLFCYLVDNHALKIILALLAVVFLYTCYSANSAVLRRDTIAQQRSTERAHRLRNAAKAGGKTVKHVQCHTNRIIIEFTDGQTLEISASKPIDYRGSLVTD